VHGSLERPGGYVAGKENKHNHSENYNNKVYEAYKQKYNF
jgi:hypothetical protein